MLTIYIKLNFYPIKKNNNKKKNNKKNKKLGTYFKPKEEQKKQSNQYVNLKERNQTVKMHQEINEIKNSPHFM